MVTSKLAVYMLSLNLDPGEIPAFEDHLHSLFKVVHVGPLATSIQALMFLFQVMESRQAVSGRFYQALYAKLMDPALKHSSKQASLVSHDRLVDIKHLLHIMIVPLCTKHSISGLLLKAGLTCTLWIHECVIHLHI